MIHVFRVVTFQHIVVVVHNRERGLFFFFFFLAIYFPTKGSSVLTDLFVFCLRERNVGVFTSGELLARGLLLECTIHSRALV